MRRPVSLKIIMLLALVQGLAGLLRGFNWIQIGVDLFGKGILLLPLIGTMAMMHGLFIWVVALLYVSFVLGALQGSRWAWWSCLIAAVVNLLLALSAFVQGASLTELIAWSVIPAILIFYLFSQMGQDALKGA
jgi:Ca2+/Na+ antiporter